MTDFIPYASTNFKETLGNRQIPKVSMVYRVLLSLSFSRCAVAQ